MRIGAPLIYFFIMWVGLFLLSPIKRKGAALFNILNIILTGLLSLYALTMDEIIILDKIIVRYPDSLVLALSGVVMMLFQIYPQANRMVDSYRGIFYALSLIVAYFLLGIDNWIGIFICYKALLLTTYPLSIGQERSLPVWAKGLFSLNTLYSSIFALAILFYFLATGSFSLEEMATSHQDFFFTALVLFTILLAVELSLFPFHGGFESLYGAKQRDWASFMILLRRSVFAYFLIMILGKMVVHCDPPYQALFFNMVKGFVLLNFALSALLLSVQKDIIEIISSLSMANMSLAFLAIILPEGESSRIHLLFYLLFFSLSFLGINQSIPSDYRGQGEDSSIQRVPFALFLLSMIGFPLTAGFTAKFFFFNTLFKENMAYFVLASLIVSLCSMPVGFRLLRHIVLLGPKGEKIDRGNKQTWILSALAFLVIIGGVAPALFLK